MNAIKVSPGPPEPSERRRLEQQAYGAARWREYGRSRLVTGTMVVLGVVVMVVGLVFSIALA